MFLYHLLNKNVYLCSDYEKSRNMENPFEYESIVEADYFTDKVDGVNYISKFGYSKIWIS